MKNSKYILLVLFTLLYSSCSDDEYLSVEEDTKQEELNKKYGLQDVDLSSIKNFDSVMHFRTTDEADEFLSNHPLLNPNKEFVGYSEIKVISLVEGNNNNVRGPGDGEIITLTFYPGIPGTNFRYKLSGYSISFIHETSPSGQSVLKEFKSNLVGFVLNVDWVHQNGTARKLSNGNFDVTVSGIQEYYLVVKGVGKFYQQNTKIKATYNPKTKTGEIKSVENDNGYIGGGPVQPRPGSSGGTYGTSGDGGSFGSGSGGSFGGSGSGSGSGGSGSGGSGGSFTYGTSMGSGYTGSGSGVGSGSRGSGSSGSSSGSGSSGSSGSSDSSGSDSSGSATGGPPCGQGTVSRPCPPGPLAPIS